MLTGKYLDLYGKLTRQIDKKRIYHDPLYTLALGADASFYRLIPKMVIKAKDEREISLILQECSRLEIPVTFRAAGTSLSGQAITDSVLVIASEYWKNCSINEDGSEGTLGFISEIKLNTVIENPFRASSLMIFPDIQKACTAVSRLKSAPVAAVELIDRSGLRAVENEPGIPGFLKTLSPGASALLVETSSNQKPDLHRKIEIILTTIGDIPVEMPVKFTENPEEYAVYWDIRKGLFPSVGAMSKNGTTVIIEDVVFPVHRLADESIDKCIECGFCEPSCVSAGLTLTPRQRIQKSRRRKITGTGGCTSESQQ